MGYGESSVIEEGEGKWEARAEVKLERSMG